MPNTLASTEEIVAELRAGKMVILVDEEDRENEGDLVLDPFCGSGTTGVASCLLNRRFVGIDLEKEFLELTAKRMRSAYEDYAPYI